MMDPDDHHQVLPLRTATLDVGQPLPGSSNNERDYPRST